MEKKVTMRWDSLKIAKGNDQKKRLGMICNSLIKVLRPRVFITEASDVKRLVQELTGNGSHSQQQPIPHGHPPCPCPSNEVSSSMETQASGDFAGILERVDSVALYFTREVPCAVPSWHPPRVQIHGHQLDKDELLTFRDIEGWLMDIDSSMASFERYVTREVGIYDFFMEDC